jgi:hypothetical protein
MKKPFVASYYIPESRLFPNAVDDIRSIYDSTRDEDLTTKQLSELWKYSSPTTPILYKRLNSLLAFGLLSGRGKFKVTELGKDMSHHLTEDRGKLLRRAFFNVPLWKELYSRFGKDGGKLPADNLWWHLMKMTGVHPPEAKDVEREVRDWYTRDISSISLEEETENRDDNIDQKDYSSNETLKQDMEQELSPLDKDGGKLIMNYSGKKYNMDFDDKDSLEVIVNALNMFGKKLGLKIESKEEKKNQSQSVDLQQHDESA